MTSFSLIAQNRFVLFNLWSLGSHVESADLGKGVLLLRDIKSAAPIPPIFESTMNRGGYAPASGSSENDHYAL